MSTFKKLLALTLALAMVLSVSAFAGYSADTYKDGASINEDCEEAVELMYALDIMTGDTNGNFNPEATITRAEVAKMIYVILNYGDDDKAVNYVGAAFFSDVAKGAWYEGYVNYLATTKLVQGRPDGTFGPNDPVTTAEVAKMLLTAIGYSAADRGYTGANWAQNVLSDAAIVELLNNYDYSTSGYAPRQWVAVMFENALGAYTYKTMRPVITGGLLTSANVYTEGEYITMGAKYYHLADITRVAIATPDASILGNKLANSGRVLFQDGDKTDKQIQIKNTGLGVADLGQEYRIIYNTDDMKAYSVRSVSAVAESRTLDVEVDVKYGTSSNKAKNTYVFTIDEMAASLDADEDYYDTDKGTKVNVLFSGINEDASDKFVTLTVEELEDVMTSNARNNNEWKAIDTDADGDIDFFYVTEYDYAYVDGDDTHNKYGDYITAYDLSSEKDLEFNKETRLYVEDCIITEDEIVEGNIVKYSWSLDDGQYVMEVLPLEEEVTYDSRDAKKGIYELGGEDYMIADEAEAGIAADVLKAGNLGESVDFVCDGDLIVWAALTDSNFTEIADVNAQLVLVLDAMEEYSGGKIREQDAIEYMTIDGETHIAGYQDGEKYGVDFNDIYPKLTDKQNDNKKYDNDRDDQSYTVEDRLYILHEGTKGRVYLEELISNDQDKDEPNEQLDASTNLLDDYKVYEAAKLSSNSSTVKLDDDKLAAEHSFFYGYYNSHDEAVYDVITTEELLNGKAEGAYAQVLTLDNDRGTRTTIVAGYIFTPDLDGNIDDGYLFVDDILRQIDEDYYRANVTFMDGETDEINIADVEGGLYEGALYTYGYNIVDDDYTLSIVEVDDSDNEIIDLDDDYVIFKKAVLDNLKELELGDEIDDVANVTIAVTRNQNRDEFDKEADFYEYEIVDYGFVALEDVTVDMIIDNEKVSGDLQYTDFMYDSKNDVLYVVTWVCMDRYTGDNLKDSPLAFIDNSAEAALKAAKAEALDAMDSFVEWALAEEDIGGGVVTAADENVAAVIAKVEAAIDAAKTVEAAGAVFAYDADAEGEKWTSTYKQEIMTAIEADKVVADQKAEAEKDAAEIEAIRVANQTKVDSYVAALESAWEVKNDAKLDADAVKAAVEAAIEATAEDGMTVTATATGIGTYTPAADGATTVTTVTVEVKAEMGNAAYASATTVMVVDVTVYNLIAQ